MDDHTVQMMLELLHGIDEKADGMIERQDHTNGRLAQAEVGISRLKVAVFGGGAGVVAALWYLIQMHLK